MSQAIDELLALAHDMGGSMEYCHGAGIRLSHLMGREHGTGFDVLQRVKESLDPHNILNPGKLSLGKQVAGALPFNSAAAASSSV